MTRSIIFLLLLSVNLHAKGGRDSIFTIADLPTYEMEANLEPAVTISGPWRFMKGDNPRWADSAFSDSLWTIVNPNLDTLGVTPGFFGGIGWFRTRVMVAPQYADVPLALMMTQSGASEIYVDGQRIHAFGIIVPKNP